MRPIELKVYAPGTDENHTYHGIPNAHWDEQYIDNWDQGNVLSVKNIAKYGIVTIMEPFTDNSGEAIDAALHTALEELEDNTITNPLWPF